MNRTFKKIKFGFRLITILLAVLTVPMLFSGCTSSSSDDPTNVTNVAKNAAQAFFEGNASAYYSFLAPGYVDYINSDTNLDQTPETLQDFLNTLQTGIVKRFGENYSVTVSVISVKPCENRTTFEKVVKELVRDYNYEENDIEDVAQVELNLQFTGKNTSDESDCTMDCVKERGKWYIFHENINALS